jgi:hypothetical protein
MLRKAQSQYEMARGGPGGSGFQRTIALELAIEDDEDDDGGHEARFRVPFRHTFGPERSTNTDDEHQQQGAARRMSTGDLLAENQLSYPANGLTQEDLEHRVDWTQSDEPQPQHRPRITPLLRKPDSRWTLRGRLGSFTKQGKEEKALLHPDKAGFSAMTADMPKSPVAGFFARFKR